MSIISASTTSTTAYKVTADTTGTLVLQTGSTPTTAVTVGTDQSVTLAGTLAVQSQNISPYTGMKNRIINGAMMIDQRNAGAAVNTTSLEKFIVDRWKFFENGSMDFSGQRSTTAPAGFLNSLLITTAASSSPSSGQRSQLQHPIEGLNVADLGWGAAGAQTITLSFWVRSSLTGQFGGALQNGAQNYSYPFSFTISSANTFEFKTVTVAGPTAGTWNTDNTTGILINFDLGMGSSLLGTAGSWSANDYRGATGDVKLSENNGATFYITGVQLEKGSTATSFDYRPYGTELALCQRYYQVGGVTGAPSVAGYAGWAFIQNVYFKVTMRAAPTIAYSNQLYYPGGTSYTATADNVSAERFSTTNQSGAGGYAYTFNWTATGEL